MFRGSKDEKAQIVHVTHNGEFSSARKVQTYIHNRGILDDLDVRASDLLQANAVIWVEGPSDRLYVNRWIELFSDGHLREGAHYQCVFYGGRLLSHLSAPIEQAAEEHEVNLLRVNGHAILMMDSDRKSAESTINTTKQRLQSEIEKAGGFSWVTDGREAENYIPLDAIRSLYPTHTVAKSVGQYQDIARYLDGIADGEGDRFERNKVEFADKICPFLTKEMLSDFRDWSEKMQSVCDRIRTWNNLKS